MTGALAPTRFNPRAFVSIVIALAAAGLPITGYANHLLQADPLTGARHAWMAAHTSLGVVFAVFAAWHVLLNRRALLAAVRTTRDRTRRSARELRSALAVVGLTTALAVGHALIVP